ncbi:vitamin B12 ABC transporter ATP-binding protein BtuD [Vibrio sinaloensis]|uniref:vitamin B12 ABC transporter ATP-binding protein BtuD n=1 Tax=Photobacterium sp. (strain ATCC 43367) TaxID=379097 RepID=UPI00204B2386|nr:vitamin B12 ABC transporter ATP-binding protein BtuD [Vibrio sinaloensis]UPQ86857.1 vitamin B12 ABC transporter ATP-binding protein BtuD [Vibrio sinaloensis]
MIRVNSISVGSRLLPLSFEMAAGEIIHVIGPNGSGKSTLLSALSGLIPFAGEASIGTLDVASSSVESLAQYRAFLSQNDRPAFNLDVVHYLSLSLPSWLRVQRVEIEKVVAELAELLDIADKLHRSIHHLSGGEWQRVRLCAICLQVWPTLNPQAQLLVLDEPAAPLDIGQESLLYQLIDRVASMGIAVLMSNHDLNRTLKHADKVLLLDKGVLQHYGSTEHVLNPEYLSAVFNTQVSKVRVNQSSVLLFD